MLLREAGYSYGEIHGFMERRGEAYPPGRRPAMQLFNRIKLERKKRGEWNE